MLSKNRGEKTSTLVAQFGLRWISVWHPSVTFTRTFSRSLVRLDMALKAKFVPNPIASQPVQEQAGPQSRSRTRTLPYVSHQLERHGLSTAIIFQATWIQPYRQINSRTLAPATTHPETRTFGHQRHPVPCHRRAFKAKTRPHKGPGAHPSSPGQDSGFGGRLG